MDSKNGLLQQQTKTAGPVLPAGMPENISASAPRRTASAAGLPGPNTIPFSQKYLVVPTATGKRVLAGKLERMDTKDSLETDGTDVSPPPSPTAGGGKDVAISGEADGVRATTRLIKDPISAFTILRADWDGRRAARATNPFLRTWIRPYQADDDWTTGATIITANPATVGFAVGRHNQVTAGQNPAANERLGPIVKWKKLKMKFLFTGAAFSAYNGGTPNGNNIMGRIQIPQHRLLLVRDKWPGLGGVTYSETIGSDTNQKATNINTVMYGIAAAGDTTARCVTQLAQSPLTKGVRFEILVDEKWVPGTSINSPAQITVTGGLLYRSWLEEKIIDVPIDGMEQTYTGTNQSTIFTNDLIILVVRNQTPQEVNPVVSLDTVYSVYDYSYYQQWDDMTTTSDDVQPSATTSAAAGAK